MEYVSYFARFPEVLANTVHEVTAEFLKMIEDRETLIGTKFRISAEKESKFSTIKTSGGDSARVSSPECARQHNNA